MALSHGPRVVTDGLVLALDAADRNSFRGEATTNLLSNGNFSSGVWTSYNGATNTIINLFDVPPYLNTSKSVLNSATNSTQNFGNYGGIQSGMPSLTVGVTYTISYYARCLSGTLNLKFSNQNGAGDESNLSHSRTITTTWTKYTHTAALDIVKNTLFIWNSSVASGIFQITDIQIEAKSYATTFVNGTRGTTVATGGGWEDLTGTGNNGELINGVRESSTNRGELLFDGADDYVQGTISSSIFTGPHSISCWFYRETVTEWSALFSNNVNTTSCSILTFISTTNTLGTNQAGVNGTSIAVDLGADHLNKWIYTVITYAGVSSGSAINVYAYKNGSLLTASGSLYWNMSSSSSYYIGRHWTSATQIHDGFISQVKVHNRALSAAEVQQNFNATRSRFNI
jgi:hypothetical protein